MSSPDGPTSTTFAGVTALDPVGNGRFSAEVSAEWTIGGKPNGGYLLGMLGRAAAAVSTHPHVIAASAHYLRAPSPGAVTIEAQLLREGRSATQVRVRMLQGDKVCVETLMTTSQFGETAALQWSGGVPEPGAVEFNDCVRLPAQAPNGMRVNILDQIDVRLEPDSLAFAAGKPTGRGELRGWLALPGDESFDPISLLFAVDAFPPATFDVEFSGWVPTLELTAYVRALPATGPVRVLHKAQLIAADRVDESCFVWDANGTLVAQSTQLAGIRFGKGQEG